MTTEEALLEIKLAILDNIPMPVWACDRNCRIVFWNKAAERLYGYSTEQAIGKDFVDLFVYEPERDQARKDCCEIIDQRRPIRNMANDKDIHGITRPLVTHCFPIYGVGGHDGLQVEVSYEIGDIDRLQRELEQLQREYESKKQEEQEVARQLFFACRERALKCLATVAEQQRANVTRYEQTVLEIRAKKSAAANEIQKMQDENKQSRDRLRVWQRQYETAIIKATTIDELEALIIKIEDLHELDI